MSGLVHYSNHQSTPTPFQFWVGLRCIKGNRWNGYSFNLFSIQICLSSCLPFLLQVN